MRRRGEGDVDRSSEKEEAIVSGLEEDRGWGNAVEERWADYINPGEPNGRSRRRTNSWLCRTSISYSAVISLPSPKNNIRFLFFLSSSLSFAISLSLSRFTSLLFS